jgi:RNA polymerase sigma-70 factor (ECF subfamily)
MRHVSTLDSSRTAAENSEQIKALGLQSAVHGTLPSFASVVTNVRTGHPDGLGQLYEVFRVLSGSLRRQIGSDDFEDRFHDLFIVVAEAIREGKLREPGALASYIHGVARISLWSKISVRMLHQRLSGSLRQVVEMRGQAPTPEGALADRERTNMMLQMLETLPAIQREILTRFYLNEETGEDICRAMGLTQTQFRLAKSRAKMRLTEMGDDLQKSRWLRSHATALPPTRRPGLGRQ